MHTHNMPVIPYNIYKKWAFGLVKNDKNVSTQVIIGWCSTYTHCLQSYSAISHLPIKQHSYSKHCTLEPIPGGTTVDTRATIKYATIKHKTQFQGNSIF